MVYVTTFHPGFPNGENVKESQELANQIGFDTLYISGGGNNTNQLDLLGHAYLIERFEDVINQLEPHTVLIPFPSYNQDHRIVYDSALTAMRPHDKNFFVKRILVYEQPETFGTMRNSEPFKPTYFRELNLGEKIDYMSIYQSQLRGHRSTGHIEAIALVRGMQSNMLWAEAFEVLRWIE